MLLCLIDFYKFTYILHIMQQAGKKRLSADSLFPVCILYPGYQKRHDMPTMTRPTPMNGWPFDAESNSRLSHTVIIGFRYISISEVAVQLNGNRSMRNRHLSNR